MKHVSHTRLQEELKAAGASSSEARELTVVASSLKQLHGKYPLLNSTMPAQQQSRWRQLAPLGLTSLTGIVVGMALVILSQTVLPGSPLYAIQKASDHVAVSLDPNYRATVMMRRAQQVKQLVADHASSGVVLGTLTDYQNEASWYKSASTNYAAFEYCKTNLRQAAAIAPNPERQVIETTLDSLSNV